MYFVSRSLLNHAVAVFQKLEINGPQDGDWFFETFGPGNVLYFTDRPYERFCDYEELLLALQENDPNKYRLIHKGTPFYYLSWTAFDLRNFVEGSSPLLTHVFCRGVKSALDSCIL